MATITATLSRQMLRARGDAGRVMSRTRNAVCSRGLVTTAVIG